MSKGLALPLLLAQKEVFKNASPADKLSPMGTMAYMLAQSTPSVVSQAIDAKNGYIRDVNVRYRKRAAAGTSVTADDCSIQTEPAWFNQTLPTLLKRFKGVWFDFPTIKQFTADALATQNAGTPATPLMMEVIDTIRTQLNGLLLDINTDLLTALTFGKNVSTGLNTVKTVNFPLNTTNLALASGMTDIMNDAMLNEANIRDCSVIGSGIVNMYYLQQAAKGNDQSGLTTNQLAMPKMFFDPAAATVLGANQFALVEQDALQFINVCYNRAAAISGRLGNSEFGTIKFPVADSMGNSLRELEFDWQVKEEDCPGDRVIAGNSVARGRGYTFILGCHYAPLQIPSTAYETTDRMTQVNGVWRYVATNA